MNGRPMFVGDYYFSSNNKDNGPWQITGIDNKYYSNNYTPNYKTSITGYSSLITSMRQMVYAEEGSPNPFTSLDQNA